MFSRLVNVHELLSAPLTFALGGPRTGKTTLLEKYVLPQVAKNFQDKPYLVSLIQIRPYWLETEEVRNRVAATLLRGILLFSDQLPKEVRETVFHNLQQNLSHLGIPTTVSPKFIELYLGEYWRSREGQQQVDPLRWSLEMFCTVATAVHSDPYLLLDDADFVIRTGILGEVLHLCSIYQIGVLANVRSLCDSRFDSPNPLVEYAHTANFVCLDLLPTDPVFRSLCESILVEQVKSEDDKLSQAADRVQLDSDLFETSTLLSGGQIGRFREVIQFLASCQDNSHKWNSPSRRDIGDFCKSRVEQMLQREADSSIKETIKQWVTNLGPVLRTSITTELKLMWFKLPVGQIDELELPRHLSIVRGGVLAWILQCSAEDRINVAKQTRFVPSRFKVSPLAAIAGQLSLKKAMG